MKRRLFIMVFALSLLLCVAACAWWAASYRWEQELSVPTGGQSSAWVASCGGQLHVNLLGSKPRGFGFQTSDARLKVVLATGQPLGFGFFNWGNGNRLLVIPHWFLAVLPATIAAWAGVGLWRRSKLLARRGGGRCANCGYDLRATPGRCPECGTEAKDFTATDGAIRST